METHVQFTFYEFVLAIVIFIWVGCALLWRLNISRGGRRLIANCYLLNSKGRNMDAQHMHVYDMEHLVATDEAK